MQSNTVKAPLILRKDERYDNALGIEKVENGKRSILALMNEAWICDEHGDLLSNARMFAAAPELLSVLIDLIDCFWDQSPLEFARSRGHNHMDESIANEYVGKARMAVLRALGKD